MNGAAMVDLTQIQFNDQAGNVLTDTIALNLVNRACEWVVGEIEKLDLDYFATYEDISVTAVTDHTDQSSNLPSTYRKSISFERLVSGNRSIKLPFISYRDRDLRTGIVIPEGFAPGPFVSVFGSTVRIIDPQQSFTLRHFYLPTHTDIVSTGTSTIPTEYHQLVCARATYVAYASFHGNPEFIRLWRDETFALLQHMQNTIVPRQSSQERMVR